MFLYPYPQQNGLKYIQSLFLLKEKIGMMKLLLLDTTQKQQRIYFKIDI